MPRKFIKSFKFARAGVEHAIRTQRNLWIHLGIGAVVVTAAYLLKISLIEFALLAVVISLVIVTELINTAIEELVNILSPGHQLEAKLAKDVAAAAVLLAAVGSIIVGGVIFIPKLLR